MTEEHLKALIVKEHLQIVCGGNLAVCVFELVSGFTIVGTSPPLQQGASITLACELARERAMKDLDRLERYRQNWAIYEEAKKAKNEN